MIGNQKVLNPTATKYGQQMEKVRYSGADSDHDTYYEKFSKDGKEYYYISDPMKIRANKTGTTAHYDVPNLYLAYQQKFPGIDQHVFEADKFFGNQSFSYLGKDYNTSDWAGKKLDFGGRSGIEGQNNELIQAAKAATPQGYVFSMDPYSYGKQSYKKNVGNTWGDFFTGLGNIVSVAAAPLTAGLGAFAGLSRPMSSAIIGGLGGALKNKDNPLMGAISGGLGSLAAPALSKVGITNPIAQGALSGGGISALLKQNVGLGALMGGVTGGINMLGKMGTPQQMGATPPIRDAGQAGSSGLKLGDQKMDFGGGGLGFDLGGSSIGGGGGGSWDFMNNLDFGGDNFGDYSSLNTGGSGLGLNMGGGGMGFQMPDLNWNLGSGISFDSGLGLKGPGGSGGNYVDAIGGGGGNWQNNLKELGGALAGFSKIAPWKEIIGAAGGAYSNNQAMKRYQNAANQASQRADPFASQRAQYQSQLANLMANPNEITNDPSYQFRMQQGQDAVARMNSARGYNMSGNEMMAMQDYAQGFASDELGKQRNFLAQLGGANFGPGNAGSVYMQGQGQATDAYQQYLAMMGLLGMTGYEAATGDTRRPWE